MKRNDAIAAGWGFAEAILWFIIPDVFISLLGVRKGMRAALRMTGFAVIGAVLGGIVTYGWGAVSLYTAQDVMAHLPGVDSEMVDRVSATVAAEGSVALLGGPSRAQPYKLYALAAGEHDTGVLELALWTIPGRAARFILSSFGAAAVGWLGRRFVGERFALAAWALFWVAACVVVWSR